MKIELTKEQAEILAEALKGSVQRIIRAQEEAVVTHEEAMGKKSALLTIQSILFKELDAEERREAEIKRMVNEQRSGGAIIVESNPQSTNRRTRR